MFKEALARQQQEEALRTVVAVTTLTVLCTLIVAPFVLAAKAFGFACRVADRTIIALLTFL
jgi:hypothetical protein